MKNIYLHSTKVKFLILFILGISNHLLLAQLPNISYSPLHSDGSFNGKSIDVNLPVGSTPGSGDAGSGAASYTIPIAVPAGTAGVVPSLSVSYNSMGGNGIMGMGWGLSGMSAITRVGKNFYHDGEVRAADFSWQDKFALDGKRLIGINGDYGGNGSTYGTENEDYSIVIFWQTKGEGQLPAFEIQTADGMNMLYGTTADSRITDGTGNNNIITWLLKRVKYPNGNYITYDYTQFGLETVLSKINYTGHVIINANGDEVITQNPYNTVEFEYKNRSDKNFYYQVGVKLETKVLLDRIVVKAEGANFKTYNFTYGRNNNLSYLKEIYETGTDGSAFNSTAFRYGDSPTSFSQTTTSAIQNDEGRFQLGDYNADGYSDILFTTTELRDNKRWDVNITIKTRIPGEDDIFSSNYIATLPQNSSVIDKVKYPNGNSISPIDYTGDGFNDIFITEYEFVRVNGRNEQSIKNMFIYENQRNTSFVKQTLNLPSAKLVSSVHGTVFGGDFNGDGVQDILVANSSSSVRLSRLSNDFVNLTNNVNDKLGFAGKIIIFDFNADGKSDILTIANSDCRIYTLDGIELREIFRYDNFLNEKAKIQLGDFNGDGKMDFLYRNSETDNNSPWKIRYSTGREFTPETTFSFQSTPNIIGGYSDDHLALADFNGDGKTDIYHAVRNSSRFDIYYSKANNEFETQSINGVSFGYTQTPPGDINGDGVADVIDRDSYRDPAKIFYFNKNRRDHLLQKVKNGIGHVTEWQYERLNKDGDILDPFYRRSNPNRTFPINSIKVPMRAVSAFKVTNGVGGIATKTFKYKDAILHIGGKGFMGFEKIITTDISADVIVEAENEVNNSKYLLLPKRTDTYKYSNLDLLSESSSSIQVVDAGGVRYRVQVNSSTQVNHFEKKSSVTTNAYNGYGLVTSSNTKLYGGNQQFLVEESNSSAQYGQHGSRIPNKPTNVTISKNRSGYNSNEVKTMEYDGYGQLTAKTDFAGQSQSVRTEYSYDALGNITQTRLQPSNMVQRTVSSSYDDKGRFVLSSTNVLNQTSSSSYNSFGQVTSTIGIDGLTISFQYDGFGRLTKTTLPTGIEINQSKGWGFGYGAIYYNNIQHPYRPDQNSGKPDQKTFYDILGREVRTETDGFGGKTIITDKTYTDRGQIAFSSQEHYRSDQGADPYLITNNDYDSYNRLTSSNNQLAGTTFISYSYSTDGKMTINTTDPGGRNSSKVMDAAGKTIQSTDNGGTQTYVYNAQDKLMSVTNTDGTVLNTSVYDYYGRQTQLNDLSAGTTNYSYDALGQLTSETNAKNQTHNMSYDIMGRITLRTGPEGNTSTEYYGTDGAKTNQLKKITGFSGETTEYYYNDGYGRLTNIKVRIDNTDYNSSMNYNIYGDLIQKTFPSNLVIKYNYEGNGYLQFIRKGNDNVIFQNTDQNALGQVKSYNLGNGRGSSNSYNYGIPTQYYTGGVQHLALDWNDKTGNLKSRTDYFKNIEEAFTYDDLDRLTSTQVRNRNTNVYSDLISMGFAPSGNITSKTDVGNYVYDGTKKHAVKKVNGATSAIPSFTQDIDFTSYERPEEIRENGYKLRYTYGADYERIKGVMTQNGNNVYTRYFLGDFERNIQNGTTKDIHYISSPAGLIAIVVRENGNDSYNYTYTDHLGSILTIEKSDGIFVHQNFDAWGRRRDTDSWMPMSPTAVTGLPDWLYRGYTGHEHLDQFGIINMNARLYDPVLGRMISPDNFINGAFGTQGYNRYSYANNNPLKYIDPSGNMPFLVAAGILLIKAALISSISTLAIQATTSIIAGNFTLSPDAIAKSGLQGAVGAALGFGVGQIFSGLSGFGIDLAKAAFHAASGGVQSAIFGGNFGDGAISGLVGSLTGSAGTSLGISNSLVGSYLIGGTASAITSQFTGGDPFQAFITGGTAAAFNHYLHKLASKVTVYVWEKDNVGGIKDVGHTAIRIGNKIYGFYPGDENNNGYGDGDLLYSNGEMHIDTPEIFRDTDHYFGDNIEAFDLKLTHGTIVKLEKILQSYAGHYSFAGAQCTSVACGALQKSGAWIRNPFNPLDIQLPTWGLSPQTFQNVLQSPINSHLVGLMYGFKVNSSFK